MNFKTEQVQKEIGCIIDIHFTDEGCIWWIILAIFTPFSCGCYCSKKTQRAGFQRKIYPDLILTGAPETWDADCSGHRLVFCSGHRLDFSHEMESVNDLTNLRESLLANAQAPKLWVVGESEDVHRKNNGYATGTQKWLARAVCYEVQPWGDDSDHTSDRLGESSEFWVAPDHTTLPISVST